MPPEEAAIAKELQTGAALAAPEGVDLTISKVWMHSLLDTGSDFSSLTDPSEDAKEITVSLKDLAQPGAMGDDKINFVLAAHLEKLGYVANVAIAIAWDPQRFPTAPLLFQTNLKSKAYVETALRSPYLPHYTYMQFKGPHKLVIMAQLREVANEWKYKDSTYEEYSEFPHIGDVTIREIKVNIVE
jgi:hypothetical protein